MRRLTKSVEKRISIQHGITAEELRRCVATSERKHPRVIDRKGLALYMVDVPKAPSNKNLGFIVIPCSCFVKEG